jgi:hypothetical protein
MFAAGPKYCQNDKMNNLGIWVVRNIKKILLVFGTIVILEVGVSFWGYSVVRDPSPAIKALETTGGFLMTLNSPEVMPKTTFALVVAHYLGWAVSFIGWLILPLLIGVSLAHSQSLDQEFHELKYKLLRRAQRCGLSKEEAEQYAAEMLKRLEKVSARKDRS